MVEYSYRRDVRRGLVRNEDDVALPDDDPGYQAWLAKGNYPHTPADGAVIIGAPHTPGPPVPPEGPVTPAPPPDADKLS